MATKEMKFNFFKINVSKVGGRDTKISFNKLLYSKIEETNGVLKKEQLDKGDGIICGTFVFRQMDDLPPSVDSSGNIEALQIDKNKGLGHLTSFLFDTNSSILAYESTLKGVSVGQFLSFHEQNSYKIKSEVIIDPSEFERFDRLTIIKKLSVKIARPNDVVKTSGNKTSIGEAISFADKTNAENIEYTIVAGRAKSKTLIAEIIKKIVLESLTFYKKSGVVEKLIVTGREEGNTKASVIDFIENRVKFSIKMEKTRHSIIPPEKYNLMVEEYNKLKPMLRKVYS